MNVLKIDGHLRLLRTHFVIPGSGLLCGRSGHTPFVAIMCNSWNLDPFRPYRGNISVTLANPRRQRPELPRLAQKAELRIINPANFTVRECFAFGRSMVFEALRARCRVGSKVFAIFCFTV